MLDYINIIIIQHYAFNNRTALGLSMTIQYICNTNDSIDVNTIVLNIYLDFCVQRHIFLTAIYEQ